jgi:hypothetical protein
MNFGVIDADNTIQLNERFRIDVSASFSNKSISKVEIEPEATIGFFDVYNADKNLWTFDWMYLTEEPKTVTLKLTDTDGVNIYTKTINAVSALTDYLYSNDDELKVQEPDIMKWLPSGRSSWNFVHRKVQDAIVTEIYKDGITSNDGSKVTKQQIKDVKEVQDWATFEALVIIFLGISNAVDDIYMKKSSIYKEYAKVSKDLAMNKLGIDLNKDGLITANEELGLRSATLVRR